MISAIFAFTFLLIIKHCAADDVSLFGSTRGCDTACQKECIEVINKYRLNHRAKEVTFSQFLADKAQNWADGGRFGYDMKSRGKFGQLIEWDVKDELQNFTTVIKHWHDKEKDFDFAEGRSKTGKTLHDFTQIVWKKAKKAGCGQSEIFNSKYYVVWMDSDGVIDPSMKVRTTSIGSPEKEDLHWFEPAKESINSKPTHVVPSKAQDEDSSTRNRVEALAPGVPNTATTRSEQSKPTAPPDLNEVKEEQKVLNDKALLSQYLYSDNLNKVVLNENKETASYHVVSGGEENANWQKGSESLVQLGKDKGNTTQTPPNNREVPYPGGDTEEDDSKEATRFQSQVIQEDDMLTKDEADENGTSSSEASDSDELGEGDEREQAAKIQSLMKQEDDMIQNQDAEEDEEESSGGNSTAEGSTPGTSNVDTNSDMTTRLSNHFANSNESVVNGSSTANQHQTAFYASGIALSNNPNDTIGLAALHDKPSLGSSEDIANSSSIGQGMINQSSTNIHNEPPGGSPLNGSVGITQEDKDKDVNVVQPSRNSSSQNDQAITTNGTQSFRFHHNKMINQANTIQQSDSTGGAAAPGLPNTSSMVDISGMKSGQMASSPKISSFQVGIKPSQQQAGMMPMMPNSQSRLTLSDMIVPGATAKPKESSPDVSHLDATNEQPEAFAKPQENSPSVSQLQAPNERPEASGKPKEKSQDASHPDSASKQHQASAMSQEKGPEVSYLDATNGPPQASAKPQENSPGVSHQDATKGRPQAFAKPQGESPGVSHQDATKGQQQASPKPPEGSPGVSYLEATNGQPQAFAKPKGQSPDVSRLQVANAQPQQSGPPTVSQNPVSAASGSLKNEASTLAANTLSPGNQVVGTNAAVQSPVVTPIKASDSVSDVHHVSSPARITLPSASNRPIKLVFHVQDMKSNDMSSNAPVSGSNGVSGYQSTPVMTHDLANKMNDEECHDDTLQCQLWAHHGHCKGIAYTEFMKRHCKATCGYCCLPSVIKQSENRIQTHSLAQDEPCQDAANYEFSCPQWQAQGYCDKKENEMKLVCRKTCGFCAPTKNKFKSSYSPAFQPLIESSQAGAEKSDRNNGEMQAPMRTKPFLSTPQDPNTNDMANNAAKFTPLNISPLKPKVSLIQYMNNLPKWPSFKPLGGSTIKQNSNPDVKNSNEASGISTQASRNEQSPADKSGSLPFKSQDGKLGIVGSKGISNSTLKLSGVAIGQNTQATLPNQIGLKTPTFLSRGQGVSSKLNNKAPVNMGLILIPTKARMAGFSSSNEVSNQNPGSEKDDKMIHDGILALQRKLQAPLQISAVAKSNAGCKERLCKEKVKTQQAKTREIISNQAPASFARNTAEKPVSTTGCDLSCQQECLAAHNRYRLNHDAPPLVLDQKLADQAQQWADKKVFKHSPWAGGQGGETIALGSLYPTFTAAVKAWHDEEKDYDWSTGTGNRDMKVNHFTQVVWKGAHLLGCGKTFVNGEPYYIAQMDTPGVIAGVPGYDKSNVGEPKEPDLMWFMNSSPYWKEMQTKNYIPKNIEHRLL